MVTLEPFAVGSERRGRTHRLIPRGELDLATAPLLREAFDDAVRDGDAEKIVIDLTELAFMDSSGINLLLQLTEACSDTDRLRIVNGAPMVVRVLDISGARPRLPIITSAEDPLAPLPQRSP